LPVSITKNTQTNESLKKITKNAFENLDLVDLKILEDGYFNVAYLIKLSDKSEVILKIAPKEETLVMEHEKNIMFTEVTTMKLVKFHTDLPVAEVLFYYNSKTVCDSEYFFMEKIDGQTLNTIEKNLTSEQMAYIR
jgi:aminoglycoside phosphotransferase (APT) family kinase protein